MFGSITTMNDEVFYNQVAEEIQAKKMMPGLWTKAFAKAGGDADSARAIYIKLRVAQLAQVSRRSIFKNYGIAVRNYVYGVLFLFCMAIAAVSAFATLIFFFSNDSDRISRISGSIACSLSTLLGAIFANIFWKKLRKATMEE